MTEPKVQINVHCNYYSPGSIGGGKDGCNSWTVEAKGEGLSLMRRVIALIELAERRKK